MPADVAKHIKSGLQSANAVPHQHAARQDRQLLLHLARSLVLARLKRIVDSDGQPRRDASDRENPSRRPDTQSRIQRGAVPRQHGKFLWDESDGLREREDITGAIFYADDVLMLAQARDRLWRERDIRKRRRVVQQNRDRRSIRNGEVMIDERTLRHLRAVKVRRDDKDGIGAGLGDPPHLVDRCSRALLSSADDER